MKNILSALTVLTVATPVATLNLNSSNISINKDKQNYSRRVKLTELKVSISQKYRLSDTTAILKEDNDQDINNWYFFDSTKINDASQGFTYLGDSWTNFHYLSDTIGLFTNTIDNISYVFDSTKMNESNKGLTSIGTANFQANLTDKTAIVTDDKKMYLLELTETEIKKTELGSWNNENIDNYIMRLSDTIIAIIYKVDYTYRVTFQDVVTKEIIISLTHSISDFKDIQRLSDTTVIFIEAGTNNSYLFDITKINDASQGLIKLDKKGQMSNSDNNFFLRFSDTTGIFTEEETYLSYFFDSTKINDESKGFIALNIHSGSYYSNGRSTRMSDTTGILKDGTDQTYYFDSEKINWHNNKGLYDLGMYPRTLHNLTDETGVFSSHTNAYFFDSIRIMEPTRGFIDLGVEASENIDNKVFIRISDTTGILGSYSHSYYFEYFEYN